MALFYICRHRQTENNRDEKTSGWIDTPLTEEGIRNVAATAAKLQGVHFDSVYASDLGRAFITAYILTRRLGFTGEIVRSGALREASYGDLASRPYSEVETRYPKLTREVNFCPPGGESLHQMQQRVLAYLHRLNMTKPYETILIATHEGVINTVYAAFAGTDLGKVMATRFTPHDFVATFTFDKDDIVTFTEV